MTTATTCNKLELVVSAAAKAESIANAVGYDDGVPSMSTTASTHQTVGDVIAAYQRHTAVDTVPSQLTAYSNQVKFYSTI